MRRFFETRRVAQAKDDTLPDTSIEGQFVRFRDCGDAAALAAVFDATAPELMRIARYLCGARGSAEDVLQETFLTAIERRAKYDGNRPLLPWLLRLLANLVRRQRRSEMSSARVPAEVLDFCTIDASEDPRDIAARHEIDASLHAAIFGLPEPYRAVLSAYVLHGASAKAIADLRACPASTVRSQIQRGLDLLRRALPAGIVGSAVVASVSAADLVALRGEVLAAADASGALWIATERVAGLRSSGGLSVMSKQLSVVAISALFLAAALAVTLWSGVSDGYQQSMGNPVPAPGDMPAVTLVDDLAGTAREPVMPVAVEVGSNRGGIVDVRVVWRGEDVPIAGLSVAITIDSKGLSIVTQGRSDVEGLAHFDNLAAGRYFARASFDATRPITVQVGQSLDIVLEVTGYGQISGRVLDLRGMPITGAALWMSGRNVLVAPKLVGVSDKEGRYTFRSPAVTAALYAEKPGRGRSTEVGVLSFPGEEM